MAIDMEEFDRLFEPSPIEKVRQVFEVKEVWTPTKIERKGKIITVWDFELFKMMIKQWMKEKRWTKDQALDEFFDIV